MCFSFLKTISHCLHSRHWVCVLWEWLFLLWILIPSYSILCWCVGISWVLCHDDRRIRAKKFWTSATNTYPFRTLDTLHPICIEMRNWRGRLVEKYTRMRNISTYIEWYKNKWTNGKKIHLMFHAIVHLGLNECFFYLCCRW